MNIGIIIGRIGGVDGVALETEKWIEVLKKMGHETYILSGEFQDWEIDKKYDTEFLDLSFFSLGCQWDQKNAFFNPEEPQLELLYHIDNYSNVIKNKIVEWIHQNKIDLLISENASALPAHLSMGLGIKKAAQETGIPTITHDHDFAWERGSRYVSPHKEVNNFIADVFPLRLPNVFHAVINTHGQTTLKERFNRDSVVVPNVMDFSKPYAQFSDSNKTLRQELSLANDDILLFQITRIVRRKGIEVAIKLIEKLQNKKIKLIITGNHADDEGSAYYNELLRLISDLKIENQIIFASTKINNYGNINATEHYSLSDAYAHARACTYFSTYEGFGNAFVEAVLAKRPIFVNNYKPVYTPDIGNKGFKTVMLEDNNLTDESVHKMSEIIYNDKLNKEIAEYNFSLGKKYFSYDTLQLKLEELFNKIF